MKHVVVLAFLVVLGFGLDESFSDTAFPPRDWYQASTDVGTARWQRHDLLARTGPGCAFCAAEKRNIRNADWLITPQCSVAVGDSFGFWLRAKDASFRESVEVWVSDSTPFLPDFRLFGALATSSTSYERYSFDVSSLAGRGVFFAIVYVSAGGRGVLVDDVFGPHFRQPGDLGVCFPADQPFHHRSIPGSTQPAHARVHNYGQQGRLFDLFIFTHNKYGARVYSRFLSNLFIGPGEDMDVTWPGFNPGIDTGRWKLRCSLVTGELRRWNDTANGWFYLGHAQTNGGPDSAGYTWRDSDDSLGPRYQWVEAGASGTRLGGGDDELFEVPLPWPIRFYGQSCSTAYVSTNGWLALGPPVPAGSADSNMTIPDPSEPNRIVAVYWDDLASAGSESGIWYQAFGDSLVVLEWHNFGYYGFEACTLNFEALLHRTGIIELQYAWVSAGDTLLDQGMSATVGIENGTGTIGLEYVHDGDPPGNLLWSGRAIRFLPREYGIEEAANAEGRPPNVAPTILRASSLKHLASSVIFDAMGRRVPNPKSGIVFIRERSAVGGERLAFPVRKVILQR